MARRTVRGRQTHGNSSHPRHGRCSGRRRFYERKIRNRTDLRIRNSENVPRRAAASFQTAQCLARQSRLRQSSRRLAQPFRQKLRKLRLPCRSESRWPQGTTLGSQLTALSSNRCHPEATFFVAEGPMQLAAKCIGPSVCEERSPQDDSAFKIPRFLTAQDVHSSQTNRPELCHPLETNNAGAENIFRLHHVEPLEVSLHGRH